MILGGTKYVGLELLNYLTDYDVYIFSRKKISYTNTTSIVAERDDYHSLKEHIKNIKPDVVLDMICYNQKQAKIMIDILSPLAYVKHYIMVSTFFIYNYSSKFEAFEKLNIETIQDRYTKNKYSSEELIFNSSIFQKTTIVRFPFIFSSDDYSKRFEYLMKQALNEEKVIVDNKQCSFISKKDAAKSLAILIELVPQQIVDIANKGCISLEKIYSLISKIYAKNLIFEPKERDVYQIQKDICLDSSKAELFNLQSVEDAFKVEINDYKSEKERV